MTFIVTDASLWVARLVPQDTFHTLVRSWMDARRFEGSTMLAPALLFAEFVVAISQSAAQRVPLVEFAKR